MHRELRLAVRGGDSDARFALFDQRVSLLDPALSIADNFLRRNPGTTNNQCRAALARFRFRADAADRIAGTLSGGQMLRAGLACVLGAPMPPQLLILDEPGNHLDLDSLTAIEAGLAAYDGALLVVSALPVAAQETDPCFRLDANSKFAVEAILDSAKNLNLPWMPLRSQVCEGIVKTKGDGKRIVTAVRERTPTP